MRDISSFDWNVFLNQWNRDLLEQLEDDEIRSLSPEVIESKWFGYSGATVTEISEAETRLRRTFPPSYRDFLKTSNGWRKLDDFVNQLRSTREIEWLAVKNPEVIDAWTTGVMSQGGDRIPDEEYFVYGDTQDSTSLRVEYLQTALEIGGDPSQGLLLLNPQVTFNDGEWEAWFFAHWLPGAERYRSFRELMQEKHKSFLNLRT